MEKIKILTVLNNLNKCDGIASYIMNYYSKFDLSKIYMDFVVLSNNVDDKYRNIIESKGGNIFYINTPSTKSMLSDINNIKEFMKEKSNEYDIIHSHVINSGYFFLKYAKKYGIKCRILHSHNTTLGSNKFIKKVRNIIMAKLSVALTTNRFACSKEAGYYLFGNKDFEIIHNAINVQAYTYNEKVRNEYREKLGLKSDEIALLHVGRFDIQKNHIFLLETFKEILDKNMNYKLILIGTGNLQDKINSKIKELGIEKSVIMLGVRNDVNLILQACDIFLLPSLFEGLPVVAIEAQTADLTCILSDKITTETKILPDIKFCKLEKENWKNIILDTKLRKRHDNFETIKDAGYSIENEFKRLQDIYYKIVVNLG